MRVARHGASSGGAVMIDPVAAILLTPLLAAAILAVLPGYRIDAALNVFASLVSLAVRADPAVGAAAHRPLSAGR